MFLARFWLPVPARSAPTCVSFPSHALAPPRMLPQLRLLHDRELACGGRDQLVKRMLHAARWGSGFPEKEEYDERSNTDQHIT